MSRKTETAGQFRDLREVQDLLGVPTEALRRLLTLPEVCAILRISAKTLQRRIETGELVVVRTAAAYWSPRATSPATSPRGGRSDAMRLVMACDDFVFSTIGRTHLKN